MNMNQPPPPTTTSSKKQTFVAWKIRLLWNLPACTYWASMAATRPQNPFFCPVYWIFVKLSKNGCGWHCGFILVYHTLGWLSKTVHLRPFKWLLYLIPAQPSLKKSTTVRRRQRNISHLSLMPLNIESDSDKWNPLKVSILVPSTEKWQAFNLANFENTIK